jgi:hypothetical protein
VAVDDFLNNGQPQSFAAGFGRIEAVEDFKDLLQILLGDTDAIIGNTVNDLMVLFLCADGD